MEEDVCTWLLWREEEKKRQGEDYFICFNEVELSGTHEEDYFKRGYVTFHKPWVHVFVTSYASMTCLRRTKVSFEDICFPRGLCIFLCCTDILVHCLSVLLLGQIFHCKSSQQQSERKKKRKEKRYRIVLAMKLIANIKRTVVTIKDASILHSSVWLSR